MESSSAALTRADELRAHEANAGNSTTKRAPAPCRAGSCRSPSP
jgi:hypothetical protein